MPADGAPVLVLLFIRNSVGAELSTTHAPPEPILVGADKVEPGAEEENPLAEPVVVQAPLGVSQAWNFTDLIVVACETVNVKLYVVLTLAAELPKTTFLVVIGCADAEFGKYANTRARAMRP